MGMFQPTTPTKPASMQFFLSSFNLFANEGTRRHQGFDVNDFSRALEVATEFYQRGFAMAVCQPAHQEMVDFGAVLQGAERMVDQRALQPHQAGIVLHMPPMTFHRVRMFPTLDATAAANLGRHCLDLLLAHDFSPKFDM